MITNRASFFVFEPFIDTFTVVCMLTVFQLFNLVALGKIIIADAALVLLLGGISQSVPHLFRNALNLVGFKPFAHFAIGLLQLE